MKTSDFYYDLPEELIAQTPLKERDHSRMLVFNGNLNTIEHKHFYNLVDYLSDNDVLVMNRSRVIPARIYGSRKDKQEVVEILLLKKSTINSYLSLVKPGKKFKVGTELVFGDGLNAIVKSITPTGEREIEFMVPSGSSLEAEIEKVGEMPLPPYIKEKLKEQNNFFYLNALIF